MVHCTDTVHVVILFAAVGNVTVAVKPYTLRKLAAAVTGFENGMRNQIDFIDTMCACCTGKGVTLICQNTSVCKQLSVQNRCCNALSLIQIEERIIPCTAFLMRSIQEVSHFTSCCISPTAA